MTSSSPEHPAFTFVKTLLHCRELGAALARYGTAGTLAAVRRGLAGFPAALIDQQAEEVGDGTALVAKLVLQDLDAPEHQFTCQPSEEGQAALAAVQAAVFGPGGSGRSFVDSVFLASLAQAAQALELVTAALLDALAPSNCLSLLSVAASCSCMPLAAAARRLALAAFPAAWRTDPSGLLAMEEALLLSLLKSDSLQVASEVEVFHALCAWTEADAAARRPRLADRLAACVRLGTVNIPDLQLMDDHPLVHTDRQATMLIAQVYMMLVMGQAVDCPLGYPTSARRRRCQRGDAAPPAAAEQAAPRPACGAAGCAHATVFEAALCALARRQREQAEAAADAAAADLRRLSVDGGDAGCCSCLAGASPAPVAPKAPASPLIHDAPTPTGGAGKAAASAAAVPAVQPAARVRHFGLGKRAGSRRTLFDMASGSCEADAIASLADGSKSAAPAAAVACAPAGRASGSSSGAVAATAAVLAGGVSLEMGLSPNQASMRALAAQAAAPAPHPAGWEGRKRLRFD